VEKNEAKNCPPFAKRSCEKTSLNSFLENSSKRGMLGA